MPTQRLIDLSFGADADDDGLLAAKPDLNELRTICKQVIHYSVKTGHPQFHNQLFGGVDPFALAGSWITEALNTSQ